MSVSTEKAAFALFFVLATMLSACLPPEDPGENRAANLPKLTDFEREIRSLKTAGFDYIFVFKRKDGEALTTDDKQFIKQKAHHSTNRFTLAKDGRAVFAGSNFRFDDKALEELKERFDFQDFSKPAEQIEKNKQKRDKASGVKQPASRGIDRGNSN